jgi:hypothetical protein
MGVDSGTDESLTHLGAAPSERRRVLSPLLLPADYRCATAGSVRCRKGRPAVVRYDEACPLAIAASSERGPIVGRRARNSSAAGASRTGTWALAHGRKRPRGVVHAALSRARVQPSETLVVERKQVVTAELVRRSRLVQRGMPRRLARGWCLRARRRSPVPAGSRWRRAVASPRARPSAADESGRPLPAALHFSSYTAQKALMRP